MKREASFRKFIVFQYETYYPAGGMGDIVDSFDTIERARTFVAQTAPDNSEIVDRDTWETVEEEA